MSDTAQLFILAAVWTVVSIFLARLVPNWGGRIALFAVLVGVPFWELPYGYYAFHRLCGEQANLQIFERFPPQENICVDDLHSNLFSKLVKYGFTRIEVTGRSDDPQRYVASGKVYFPKLRTEVESQYCLDFVSNFPLPHRILRGATLVKRSRDGQVALRQDHFFWSGLWWQDAASPLLGRGGTCFGDPDLPIKTLRAGHG